MGQHGPFDGEVDRYPFGSRCFKVADEAQEKSAVITQFVAERPARLQVLLGVLADVAHDALPGQG